MKLTSTVGVALLLVVGTAAFAQDGTGADEPSNGVAEPTPGELQQLQDRQIQVVRPTYRAIDRVNAQRAAQGLPLLDMSLAATADTEIVAGIDPNAASAPAASSALPTSVDNSQLPYFPPIGKQGKQNSCAAWMTTYYQLSYETALARGLDNSTLGSPTIFSPKWTYNMINGGENVGTHIPDSYNLLATSGAVSLASFPYDGNFTGWDLNVADWITAISYRANPYTVVNNMNSPAGQAQAKQLLANGHVLGLPTHIESWVYGTLSDDPSTTADDANVGEKVMTFQQGNLGGHFMTVVGYNEDLWVDLNNNGVVDAGEKGCFKIANSFGTNYGNAGFIWVAYDAFYAHSQVAGGPEANRQPVAGHDVLYSMTAKSSYQPKLVAQFTLSATNRSEVSVTLGTSAPGAGAPTATFVPFALANRGGAFGWDGGSDFGTATFALDFSDLVVSGALQDYYVQVSDSTAGNPTQLVSYTLIGPARGFHQDCHAGVPATADASTVSAFIAHAYSGNDLPPVAVIAGSGAAEGPGLSVAFDGRGSSDADGTIVSFSWDFGDGSPVVSGPTPTHLYTGIGTFSAVLTVTDDNGRTGSAAFLVRTRLMSEREVRRVRIGK